MLHFLLTVWNISCDPFHSWRYLYRDKARGRKRSLYRRMQLRKEIHHASTPTKIYQFMVYDRSYKHRVSIKYIAWMEQRRYSMKMSSVGQE